jgi:CHAT domain-containing protein
VLLESGDAEAALRYAEQARARVLLDVLQRGRISESRAKGAAYEPLTLERAAALAGPNGVVLEFAVTPQRTYLFAVTPGTKPALAVSIIEIAQTDLAQRVHAFRGALESRDLAFGTQARELYNLLLAPAASSLAGRTSLVIVPDSELWNLPFQALQTPARRFVVEDMLIAYAPSLRVLSQARLVSEGQARPRTRSRRMLAIGSIRGADPDLAPLPGVERQVRSIAGLYAPDSLALAGAAATEARYKAEAGGAAIVHLAGHGVLNDVNPMYSHISLAPSPAGAEEDGRLEAREMMDLPLAADLAVLSACDTARGRTGGGEGIVGMSWALLVAGAPSTLASQWRIDASSTDVLMLSFHRRLRAVSRDGSRGRAAALAAAARGMIATPRYRHPFYWAGFVLIGDGS